MDASRPLDALGNARGKRIIVETKNGRQYVGKLQAFDMHINIALSETEEKQDGELKRKLGNVFLRGDTIILIAPQE